MAGKTRAFALTAETMGRVAERAPACFMCRRILEVIGPERDLRDWPADPEEFLQMGFPADAQAAHIRLDVLR